MLHAVLKAANLLVNPIQGVGYHLYNLSGHKSRLSEKPSHPDGTLDCPTCAGKRGMLQTLSAEEFQLGKSRRRAFPGVGQRP